MKRCVTFGVGTPVPAVTSLSYPTGAGFTMAGTAKVGRVVLPEFGNTAAAKTITVYQRKYFGR